MYLLSLLAKYTEVIKSTPFFVSSIRNENLFCESIFSRLYSVKKTCAMMCACVCFNTFMITFIHSLETRSCYLTSRRIKVDNILIQSQCLCRSWRSNALSMLSRSQTIVTVFQYRMPWSRVLCVGH